MPKRTNSKVKLTPIESMVLTIANGQIRRKVNPPLNTTAVLVMTLNRLTNQEPKLTKKGKEK